MKDFGRQRWVYLLICVILFVIEVAIARGTIGGNFVRASLGDFLVMVLIYYFCRGVFLTHPLSTAIFSVALGFFFEGLQYFHFAELLGLKKGELLFTVIGNTFQTSDLLMYTLGGGAAYGVDFCFLLRRDLTPR